MAVVKGYLPLVHGAAKTSGKLTRSIWYSGSWCWERMDGLELKGHEDFPVPEEVWAMFSWTLQAEVPEGHHGCTRFLPLLCRERKHERKQWKRFEQAGTLLVCVPVPKQFPTWGAWYWTRTAVFTWQFIDEQTHVIIIKNLPFQGAGVGVQGHPWHGMLWPLHHLNPALSGLPSVAVWLLNTLWLSLVPYILFLCIPLAWPKS